MCAVLKRCHPRSVKCDHWLAEIFSLWCMLLHFTAALCYCTALQHCRASTILHCSALLFITALFVLYFNICSILHCTAQSYSHVGTSHCTALQQCKLMQYSVAYNCTILHRSKQYWTVLNFSELYYPITFPWFDRLSGIVVWAAKDLWWCSNLGRICYRMTMAMGWLP